LGMDTYRHYPWRRELADESYNFYEVEY